MGVFGLSRGGAPTDLAVGIQTSQTFHSRGGDAGNELRGVRNDGSDPTISPTSYVAPTSPTGASIDRSADGGNSTSSLMVAVRTRPVLAEEQLRGVRKDILRVIDERTVVVLDPDDGKRYLDRRGGRTKERRYTYDRAFGKRATNKDVYEKTGKFLIDGVLNGRNGTVFAYGATGSGKTHTMVGDERDPGMMLLSLADIFDGVRRHGDTYLYDVSCSYLEVYNELIYDLLSGETHEDASTSLELRDDPERGATIAGLKRVKVADGDDVMELLRQGNARRKTEPTEANATSSRSHAVLEIEVVRRERHAGYTSVQSRGKLSLVDLAGSERASETLNTGHKLRDGANINRSLLALANCINALGKKSNAHGKHAENMYVPFRNSKLTRLLKESLSGNSRTAMVANVSCGSDQYAHTVNTLKYADRAKEIRTHVVTNLQTVESHIGDYQRLIDTLQGEVLRLKVRVKQAEANATKSTQSNGHLVRDDDGDGALRERRASGGFLVGSSLAGDRTRTSFSARHFADSREGPEIRSLSERVPNRIPVAEPDRRDRLARGADSVPPDTRDAGSAARVEVRGREKLRREAREKRLALERLLESFRENAEERLETQKNLYELEDEIARVRFFLKSDGALDSEAERKKCVVAVAENEAACLRYRTGIDVSDRAAHALAERTRDLVSSRDEDASLAEDDAERDSLSHAAASALADSLLRGRDAESSAAEAEFFLDVRESVIAEQRDAIENLVKALRFGEHERSRDLIISDALRVKALGERRLAFWDHQFEPPTISALAAGAVGEPKYGDARQNETHHESSRATRDDARIHAPRDGGRVEPPDISQTTTQPRKRAVAPDSRLSRRPGSGSRRAGSGRRVSSGGSRVVLSSAFGTGRDHKTEEETHLLDAHTSTTPQPRPESRESSHSGGSRASSGATTTSVTSVLSFRERSERSAASVASRSKKIAPGRKPPVSASGVHGSGSRLRAMQRDALRERSAKKSEANGSFDKDHRPFRDTAAARNVARGFSSRAGASGARFDNSAFPRLNTRTPLSPSTGTPRGGSARFSQRNSPHSPAKRKPDLVTPEAFIIARPGR